MKIATTIGELYPFTSSEIEAIRAYKGSGFRYLDYSFYDVLKNPHHPFLTDNWKSGILEAKQTAQELGFTFVQAHAPQCAIVGEGSELGLKATIRSIEACAMLGIKNMVIHSGLLREFKYPGDKLAYFKAIEPFFKALIPAMEKYDVNILFENTTEKDCVYGYFPVTAKDLNDLVEFMDHPLFGVAWDVGHANMDGTDHYAEIMEMGKNLKAVHVHDNDGRNDLHIAPFLGTTDYDSFMKGLIDSGYDGYFTLESDYFFKYLRNPALNGPLAHTPLEVKRSALSLLYTIAKSILSAYNLYEE